MTKLKWTDGTTINTNDIITTKHGALLVVDSEYLDIDPFGYGQECILCVPVHTVTNEMHSITVERLKDIYKYSKENFTSRTQGDLLRAIASYYFDGVEIHDITKDAELYFTGLKPEIEVTSMRDDA